MIPGTSFPDAGPSERLANWHSICLQAPLNAPTGHTAQVLAVTLNNAEDLEIRDRVGFTVSFTNTEHPEILRLSTVTVDLPEDERALEGWRDPPASERLETEDYILEPESDTLDDRIARELRKLQELRSDVYDLRQAIRIQEEKIRSLLMEDCQSLSAKWEQCRDVGCIFKASLQTIPEIFRSIRYRVGSLESQKLVPTCNPPPEDGHSWNSSQVDFGQSEDTNHPSFLTSNTTAVRTIPSPQSLRIPLQSPTKAFLRSCAIFILIIAVSALAFKLLRNSMTFRRRRVEFAARREERRARRAYNSAARRLRWRQWWEGRSSYHTAPSISSSHDLPQIEHTHTVQSSDREDLLSDAEAEPGPMQAEILGLRRVLEFVGQLVVRNEDHSNGDLLSRPPPRYEEVSGRTVVPDTNRASAGLNSSRASSLISLGTTSSVTLETLDTWDSGAPPSYRS
jgi:hypothetical protein